MNTNEEIKRCYVINPIGFVRTVDQKNYLSILPPFIPGLKDLDDFSHLHVIWWFSHFDDPKSRKTLIFDKMPFEAPALGVFACRSPMRPNPIGLSTVKMITVDHKNGLIEIGGIDADTETPILDIKPYLPVSDRVKSAKVAEWASNWPDWTPE